MRTGEHPPFISMSILEKIRPNAGLLGICVLYLVSALAVSWNRPPSFDEGWFASPPYNLIHHGNFGTTTIDPRGLFLRSELTHINQRTYWVLPLHLVTQAAWYSIAGFGLFQMRLLSITFCLLGIAALYYWTLRLTGDRLAAILAGLLVAQDNVVVARSVDSRMDWMCLGLGLIAQAAYLYWREKSLSKAILVSNILICLSLLTHPNGIIMALCLVVTILVLDFRRLRPVHFLWFAAPYLVGAAAYGTYALQDMEGFRAQLLGNLASDRVSYIKHPWTAIQEEAIRYKRIYVGAEYDPGRFAPVKILLLLIWFGGLIGQAYLGRLKSRAAVLLFLCGVIPVVVLTFFNVKNTYYLIYVIPFFAANAGCFLSFLWHKGFVWKRLAWGILAIALAVNGALLVKRLASGRAAYEGYRQTANIAASLLAPGDRLMAPPSFAFSVGMDRVVFDQTLGFYSHWCPAALIDYPLSPDEVENLQKYAPDVLNHLNDMKTVYYRPVGEGSGIYRRIGCPPGGHTN
jgi:4-amino-4-deoxy-L-arabinose transferase-like glycosyltransferase